MLAADKCIVRTALAALFFGTALACCGDANAETEPRDLSLGTELACYGDEAEVTVWDYALAICYSEDESPCGYVASEFRVYVDCAPPASFAPESFVWIQDSAGFVTGCVNLDWKGGTR